jgi:hypothetical protein
MTITSTRGASVFLKKGVPTHVVRHMHAAVLEKGALPCDELGKTLDAEGAPEVEEGPKVMIAPEDAEARAEAIEKVSREFVKRNSSKDFTAGGTPSASAVSLALGWKVDQKEVRTVWMKIRPELLGNQEAQT